MLKLQSFGPLMRRADSLEKTLMLGKTQGRRRRGQQRVRWLDGITDSVGMSLSKLWGMVKPGVLRSMGSQRDTTELLNRARESLWGWRLAPKIHGDLEVRGGWILPHQVSRETSPPGSERPRGPRAGSVRN